MFFCCSLAITCWKYHKAGGKEEEEEKDFIALNKAAIQAGLTTAHEHQTYRAIHDLRRRRPERTQTVPPIPDIVFGIQTRYVQVCFLFICLFIYCLFIYLLYF